MDDLSLIAPLERSFTANQLETAMQAVFCKTMQDLLLDDLKDLYDYGAPHLGGAKVVERFSKQDGLVVLRRPDTSEILMRVIYANWTSLGSKRGLAFLEFVLRMLWPGQFEIKRLFHSKKLAASYPGRLHYSDTPDSFLTSRVHVLMSDDVDEKEVAELAPTLAKLVPAHILPRVALNVNAEDVTMAIACAVLPYNVANHEPDFF